MADNRANKDKRQRRNRAQRNARSARSAHAGEAASIAQSASEPKAETKSSRVSARSGAKSSGKAAKPTGQDRRAAAKERMQSRYPIPGQRAMFLGLVFTLVFIGTTLFSEFPIPAEVPIDDPRVAEANDVLDHGMTSVAQEVLGDEAKEVEVTIYENTKLFDDKSPPAAAAILLIPSILCGLAYLYTKRPQRNTVWTVTLFAMTAYFMFSQPYSLFVLPTLVAVGVGSFQSRKATNEPRLIEMRSQREAQRQAKLDAKAGGAGADEVIDVEAVSEDD